MKGSTILLIIVVLWFLSSQVGKLTGSLNRASGAANNVSRPLNDLGGAGAALINAGAAAIGRWGSSGSSSSDPYSDPSYMGANYTPSTSSTFAQSASNYAADSTPGASLPEGVYGPAVPSAWSDDLATVDWSD